MKKLLLSTALLTLSLNAMEFEAGKGNFYLKGGFVGLNKEISSDVSTYSLVEQHKNIFSSKWFYKFEFSWIDSKNLVQAQSTLNSGLSTLNIPQEEYRVQGLDINFVIGRDFINKDDSDTYLGAGLLLGASMPYIKSNSSGSDNQQIGNETYKFLQKTKTELMTYKVGLNISASKQLFSLLSLYGSGSYAYQEAYLKNKDTGLDTSSNGIYQEFEAGIRFTPFKTKFKIWFITISPKLYFTAGYRYTYWQVKDVKISLTDKELPDTIFSKSDLDMKNKVAYLGVGYSF